VISERAKLTEQIRQVEETQKVAEEKLTGQIAKAEEIRKHHIVELEEQLRKDKEALRLAEESDTPPSKSLQGGKGTQQGKGVQQGGRGKQQQQQAGKPTPKQAEAKIIPEKSVENTEQAEKPTGKVMGKPAEKKESDDEEKDNIEFDFDLWGGADEVVDKSKIKVAPSTKAAEAEKKSRSKSRRKR